MWPGRSLQMDSSIRPTVSQYDQQHYREAKQWYAGLRLDRKSGKPNNGVGRKQRRILINQFFLFLFIHYVQLGRHPVPGVVTCYISTDYEYFTLKFRYGGLHEKHVVATWNCREPSQHLLKDPGKPRKTWEKMAGHRTFRVLTFSQSSGICECNLLYLNNTPDTQV